MITKSRLDYAGKTITYTIFLDFMQHVLVVKKQLAYCCYNNHNYYAVLKTNKILCGVGLTTEYILKKKNHMHY